MEKQVTHRPGVFKQPNKTHKTGRHRSKGDILKTNKGGKDTFIYFYFNDLLQN